MDAIYKHDTKLVPPLALDVRMTENTGQMDVGEGMLWRSNVEPTTFNLIAADPVQGQVSLQARVKIRGQNNLIAVRLKIDRGQILEIEQFWASCVPPVILSPALLRRGADCGCPLGRCGRLVIGLFDFRRPARRIANPPQVKQPAPHTACENPLDARGIRHIVIHRNRSLRPY